MDLGSLKYADGARKRPGKRVGRGIGSGKGKTAGRGTKGYGSRSGAKRRAWFEGGQMPIQRRLPKRGFHNKFRIEYQIVNVGDLERIDGTEVTPEILQQTGLIKHADERVKVLGDGDAPKGLSVKAHAFSKSAEEKISAAGGSVERL